MAFLADELGQVEDVFEDQSVQNDSLVEVSCSPWVGPVTANTVVVADQMLRVFAEIDGFKPLSLIARSSHFIYIFQHQLKAAHDSGKKAAIFRYPRQRGLECL